MRRWERRCACPHATLAHHAPRLFLRRGGGAALPSSAPKGGGWSTRERGRGRSAHRSSRTFSSRRLCAPSGVCAQRQQPRRYSRRRGTRSVLQKGRGEGRTWPASSRLAGSARAAKRAARQLGGSVDGCGQRDGGWGARCAALRAHGGGDGRARGEAPPGGWAQRQQAQLLRARRRAQGRVLQRRRRPRGAGSGRARRASRGRRP